MKVTIDGQELEVDDPLTILHAAERLGIAIPTMCYMKGYDPFTSCMMCTVEIVGSGAKLPACTARIADGMEIATQSPTIRNFRRLQLDLLLSDHVGDCEAPCRRGCGVGMDIPQMIRHVEAGDIDAAMGTVRKDMALPSVLERFCHGPCETPCRRGEWDAPIAIQDLTLHAADRDLQREAPYVPEREAQTGKRVAIVGAGPSGLSAAYFLALKGHACTVYEKQSVVLQRLREMGGQAVLPDWVVEGELRVLRSLGIELRMDCEVRSEEDLAELKNQYGGVLLAMGQHGSGEAGPLGLVLEGAETNVPGVFACGGLVQFDKRVLKSFAAGKRAAYGLDQFLRGGELSVPPKYYDHRMGKLLEGEIETFVAGASPIGRVAVGGENRGVFGLDEARREATRCLHCDCREKDNCQLRINSDEYGATQKHFKGPGRATYEHVNQDAGAVYESGKCIKCGSCVHVTAKEGEPYGFAFVGRGFDLKTSVSLGRSLAEGLQQVADKVVKACPTGALSHNEKLGREQG